MALVADKNAGSKLGPAEKALLDHILRPRPTQIGRVVELCQLYKEAEDAHDLREANRNR